LQNGGGVPEAKQVEIQQAIQALAHDQPGIVIVPAEHWAGASNPVCWAMQMADPLHCCYYAHK